MRVKLCLEGANNGIFLPEIHYVLPLNGALKVVHKPVEAGPEPGYLIRALYWNALAEVLYTGAVHRFGESLYGTAYGPGGRRSDNGRDCQSHSCGDEYDGGHREGVRC